MCTYRRIRELSRSQREACRDRARGWTELNTLEMLRGDRESDGTLSMVDSLRALRYSNNGRIILQ